MAVLSKISKDWDDAEDSVAALGCSTSAPATVEYEEEDKPENTSNEPSKPSKKSKKAKRKAKKRKPPKKEEVASTPPTEDVVAVVDGPLIINGAVAPQPSCAEIESVQAEEAVAEPGFTTVSMADGSQFHFPATPSTTHDHAESSPVHDDSVSLAPSQTDNQALEHPPDDDGHHDANGEEDIGELSEHPFDPSHSRSYSMGGRQEPISFAAISRGRVTTSDPGHSRNSWSPAPSYQSISIADSEEFALETSPVAEEDLARSPSPDQMSHAGEESSVTEPGSPSAKLAGQSRNEQSISTTSHPDDSSVSTTILPPRPQPIPDNVERELASGGATRRPQITYIIVNDSKETTEEQRSSDMSDELVEMPPFWTHLQSMFVSGLYSDMQIVLNSISEEFWSIPFDVHRVVLAYSPVISSMLARQAALEESKSVIYVMAAKRFSLPRAFEFAIQILYGMPLIDKANVNQFTRKALGWDRGDAPDGLVGEKLKEVSMDVALCYGAVGAFLGDTHIVSGAFELAIDLFDWNNIETAIHFGIYPEDFLLSFDTSNDEVAKNTKGGNKGKNKKKAAAKRAAAEAQLPPLHDNLNAQVVQKWAPKVASAAIQWLVSNLPTTFHFDRLAFSKGLQDRIPDNLRTGGSIATHNPALTTLTFGSHPQPSLNCTRASAILLALPFWRFRESLDLMRQKGMLTGELVKSLLQEREERRLRALREYAKQNPTNKKDKNKEKKEYPTCFKQELGYREFAIQVQMRVEEVVDALDNDGEVVEYSLHREWMGHPGDGNGKHEGVLRKFQ